MDTQLPPPVPLPPVTPVPPPALVIPPPRKSKLPLILLAILVLLPLTYLGYRFYVGSLPGNIIPAPSGYSSTTAKSTFTPIESSANQLLYLRDPDRKAIDDVEAWLIDPVTGQEQKLALPSSLISAYKHYGNPTVVYQPKSERGEVRLLNLETGEEQSFIPLTHSDPSAIENIRLYNSLAISPDSRYMVFMADFYTACPSPSPFPSGFEGGFGPCLPGESLETPGGYYLYDFEAQKSLYLGTLTRVSRWDTQNQVLYFVSYEPWRVTKALDLKTKVITQIDSTEHFGYFTYPLLSQNSLIRNEGSAGNTADNPRTFVNMQLLNRQSGQVEIFDSVEDWAVIQPFISGSSDDSHVLYIRDITINGLHRSSLYLFRPTDKKSSRLTPEDNAVSYSLDGEWIDNQTYVTSVDPIEETGFDNSNKYLVKIDITTGQITRLTDHSLVYSFGAQ